MHLQEVQKRYVPKPGGISYSHLQFNFQIFLTKDTPFQSYGQESDLRIHLLEIIFSAGFDVRYHFTPVSWHQLLGTLFLSEEDLVIHPAVSFLDELNYIPF